MVLEDESGVALAGTLLERSPGLRVLLSSGYVESDVDRMGVEQRRMPLIHKPYDPKQLLDAVRAALENSEA